MPSPLERALAKNRYFSAQSREEQARLLSLTVHLSWAVGRWAACNPLMRAKRIPQLGMTLAAAATGFYPLSRFERFLTARGWLGYWKFLSLICFLLVLKGMRVLHRLHLLSFRGFPKDKTQAQAVLVPAVLMGAWIFAIDDLLDEGKEEDFPALHARLERCLDFMEGKDVPGIAEDPLLQSLEDIRVELARFPLFAPLRPYWARTTRRLVESMLTERQWSLQDRAGQKQALPTLEQYLENSRDSLGVFPVLMCALVTMQDASVATEPAMARLDAMEREAGTCLRLANDIRSYERESAEGKLNSLTLLKRQLMSDPSLTEPVALDKAREQLRTRIESGLLQCLELSRTGPTDTGHPERFITRLASFACDFYSHHDYHHSITRPHG